MSESTVRKSVTVNAPREKAFKVFTEGFDSWWPRDHHIGQADLREAVVEPRQGGRWYEIDVDGSECNWGHVLEWNAPSRVVFAWQINASWQFDPEFLTEVEVNFVSEGPDRTRVELEHRNLDRFGDAAETARATFDSPAGWGGLLNSFALAAAP